jgi:hypothetical protein
MLNQRRLTLGDLDASSIKSPKKSPNHWSNNCYEENGRYGKNEHVGIPERIGGMVAMADERQSPHDETELLSDFGMGLEIG